MSCAGEQDRVRGYAPSESGRWRAIAPAVLMLAMAIGAAIGAYERGTPDGAPSSAAVAGGHDTIPLEVGLPGPHRIWIEGEGDAVGVLGDGRVVGFEQIRIGEQSWRRSPAILLAPGRTTLRVPSARSPERIQLLAAPWSWPVPGRPDDFARIDSSPRRVGEPHSSPPVLLLFAISQGSRSGTLTLATAGSSARTIEALASPTQARPWARWVVARNDSETRVAVQLGSTVHRVYVDGRLLEEGSGPAQLVATENLETRGEVPGSDFRQSVELGEGFPAGAAIGLIGPAASVRSWHYPLFLSAEYEIRAQLSEGAALLVGIDGLDRYTVIRCNPQMAIVVVAVDRGVPLAEQVVRAAGCRDVPVARSGGELRVASELVRSSVDLGGIGCQPAAGRNECSFELLSRDGSR